MSKKYEEPKLGVFEQLVRQQFADIESYHENPRFNQIVFRVRGREIEYDRLEKISKIMDTKIINFTGITDEYTGCPTCGGMDERYIEVVCSGVRFKESDPIPENPQIIGDPEADFDNWSPSIRDDDW